MKEASGDCSETELKSVLTLPYEFTWHSFSPIKLLPKKKNVGICIALAAYRFNPQFHGVEAGTTRAACRFCGRGCHRLALSLQLGEKPGGAPSLGPG